MWKLTSFLLGSVNYQSNSNYYIFYTTASLLLGQTKASVWSEAFKGCSVQERHQSFENGFSSPKKKGKSKMQNGLVCNYHFSPWQRILFSAICWKFHVHGAHIKIYQTPPQIYLFLVHPIIYHSVHCLDLHLESQLWNSIFHNYYRRSRYCIKSHHHHLNWNNNTVQYLYLYTVILIWFTVTSVTSDTQFSAITII